MLSCVEEDRRQEKAREADCQHGTDCQSNSNNSLSNVPMVMGHASQVDKPRGHRTIRGCKNRIFFGRTKSQEEGKRRLNGRRYLSNIAMVLDISEATHGDQHLEPHKERHFETLHSIWDDKRFKHFFAGGIAGAISRTCVSPLERNKILLQLQVHDAKFQGVFGTLKTIWKEEGFLGYFKGNGINVARIAPYTAVQFMTYEECKKRMNIPDDPAEQHPIKKLTAGAIAGIVSVATTYPMDLVRTRLAAQGEGTQKKYRGIFHCFSTILKEEGGLFSGSLFRGLGPTLIGVAPYVGLNFLIFETTKGWCLRFLNKDLAEGEEPMNDLPVPHKLFCGSVAGAVSQTMTYPIDVIRRRMQMKGTTGSTFAYNSTLHACKLIFQKEGIYGLYKGNVPNLVKVAPAIGIQFAAYEVCRSKLYGEKVRWLH